MAWNPPPMYRIRSVGDDPVPAAPAQSNAMLYLLLLAGAGAAVYFLTQPQKGGGSVGGYTSHKKGKVDPTVHKPKIDVEDYYADSSDEDMRTIADEKPKSWEVEEIHIDRKTGDTAEKIVVRSRSLDDARRFIRDSDAYREDTGPEKYWAYSIHPSRQPPGDP